MKVTIRSGFEKQEASAPGVRVFIDVFRASTTILTLCRREVADILVANDQATINALLSQDYRLVSEVIQGGYDNSPTRLATAPIAGERIALRTTNFTTALEANAAPGPMLIAAYNNLPAVAGWIQAEAPEWVEIIPCGNMISRKHTVEDRDCARLLKAVLESGDPDLPWDFSVVMEEVARVKRDHPERGDHYAQDILFATGYGISAILPRARELEPGLYRVDWRNGKSAGTMI